MKVSQLKANPTNPRIIKDDKFKKLVESLRSFPEMMEKRPMVCVTDVDGKMFPLGGNMRLRAIQELGMKEIPDTWVTLADNWTEEKRKEFTIKDNVGFGDWNWDDLANEWDADLLSDWGVDVPVQDFEQTDSDIEKEELKPYKRHHVLISFHPDIFIDVSELLEKISQVEGVEYEQSNN